MHVNDELIKQICQFNGRGLPTWVVSDTLMQLPLVVCFWVRNKASCFVGNRGG